MDKILFADIKGVKLCYKLKGEGYPVFLIHGFAKKEFWVGQISALSSQFKVIWFDNRGVGSSDRPNIPYTIEMLVEDLKGLMDFLEIQKAHLIGHSLGSFIAQNFALIYPERVDKLILLSTTAGLPDKKGVDIFKNNQIALYEARVVDPILGFYTKMKVRFTREFLKMMKSEPTKKFYAIFSAEDLIKSENVNPWTLQDIVNHSYALADHNTLDNLHKIKHKTLIIAGEKDRLTPKISNEQVQKEIPNSELKVISGGHYFPLENAPEVNKIIIDFLKS
ncbi:MAG: alpha/beta hydrolase [Candidatus Lokiarchaeota archaeon]|nr:alpha/beta hydrolase [Candidatus Lokiarchaeota archaeon]